MRPFRELVRRAFNDHLLLTNLCLGAGFMFAGDAALQRLSKPTNSDTPHDWQRTKNMAIMGTGFGVLGHFWYGFLDRRFPGKSWNMIRKKLLAECAATPAFAGYTFMTFGSLQGKSVAECGRNFRENVHLVCLADWCGYVPAQALNFYFLPPHLRFLYVCGLSIVYDAFLAWLLNRDTTTQDDGATAASTSDVPQLRKDTLKAD